MLQGKSLAEFANSFAFPVIVLNSSLLPVVVNRPAFEKLLHTGEVALDTLGAIVECQHSKKPGGCGRAVHCTGCVLRSTVTQTNDTGEAFTDVPAKLTSSAEDVFYLVSTRKVEGHVLVKLEKPKK